MFKRLKRFIGEVPFLASILEHDANGFLMFSLNISTENKTTFKHLANRFAYSLSQMSASSIFRYRSNIFFSAVSTECMNINHKSTTHETRSISKNGYWSVKNLLLSRS